ncbi:hypothetical protein TSOC_014216, partial [Tetrabaena socialis]
IVWRTKDPALESRLRSSYDGLAAADNRRLTVTVAVSGRLGGPLTLRLTDPEGRSVAVDSRLALAGAERRGMSAEDVGKALGPTLGEATLAVAGGVDVVGLDLAAGLFLPASELKAMRRLAVEALLAARSQHPRAQGLAACAVLPGMLAEARGAAAPEAVLRMVADLSCTRQEAVAAEEEEAEASGSGAAREAGRDGTSGGAAERAGPSGRGGAAPGARRVAAAAAASPAGGGGGEGVCIRVLCRSRAQVDAALEVSWLREVVVDFLEVQGLKEAVQALASPRPLALPPSLPPLLSSLPLMSAPPRLPPPLPYSSRPYDSGGGGGVAPRPLCAKSRMPQRWKTQAGSLERG